MVVNTQAPPRQKLDERYEKSAESRLRSSTGNLRRRNNETSALSKIESGALAGTVGHTTGAQPVVPWGQKQQCSTSQDLPPQDIRLITFTVKLGNAVEYVLVTKSADGTV